MNQQSAISNQRDAMKRQEGFTLIELSIVLVIIGLIVGGVLVGQDLIRAAEDRQIISYRDELLTAVNTFRLKYGDLPGDFDKATQFWGSDIGCPNSPDNIIPKQATCNGNGDGQVDGAIRPGSYGTPSWQYQVEVLKFWQHLANAELIKGQYSGAPVTINDESHVVGITAPKLPISKKVGIGFAGLWNMTLTGTFNGYFRNVQYNNVFWIGKEVTNSRPDDPFMLPERAYGIDLKIDDGRPGTGAIRVLAPNIAKAIACADNADGTIAQYSLSNTSRERCTLIFNEKF
ncbi:type II secretion system protein [Rhodopirellula europaea]|uniref:Methylation site n=1 Tax=Rhodopirellula europaea 6C TaxID=1263867 RepID=M2AXZ1_9BACT|nr:prepilin-type N-terminal cleavage/methylation domain-containing protein [Rhodopirellula europaea]EMB14859.1 methylation site [Rhodopirellula europaea 6C]